MLAIPAVKCLTTPNESLDIEKTLRERLHGENIASHIEKFVAVRNVATTITEPSDTSQKQLLAYTEEISKFITQLQPAEDCVSLLSFRWTDAFSGNVALATSNMYLELACCVWNMGSFESLHGARVDRSNEAAIRAASKRFQRAAGCFDFVLTNVLPKLASTERLPCFSENCLRFVRTLMLAQAQLCVYERSVQDMKKGAMKTSTVAQLAQQASVLYTEASVACRVSSLSAAIDSSWCAVAAFQGMCFGGAAEYWQARSCRANAPITAASYLEEIERYKRAEALINAALSSAKEINLSGPLPTSVGSFLVAIRSNRKSALELMKSLDIPVASAPPSQQLQAITPVAMAFPTIFRELALQLANLQSTSQIQDLDPAPSSSKTTSSTSTITNSTKSTASTNPAAAGDTLDVSTSQTSQSRKRARTLSAGNLDEVYFYAINFGGLTPPSALYRFTETSFSMVRGGKIHTATRFEYDRDTRHLRCRAYMWDFDLIFSPDMSCIESGQCLQPEDAVNNIPRDFWRYAAVTNMTRHELNIVRCDPSGTIALLQMPDE